MEGNSIRFDRFDGMTTTNSMVQISFLRGFLQRIALFPTDSIWRNEWWMDGRIRSLIKRLDGKYEYVCMVIFWYVYHTRVLGSMEWIANCICRYKFTIAGWVHRLWCRCSMCLVRFGLRWMDGWVWNGMDGMGRDGVGWRKDSAGIGICMITDIDDWLLAEWRKTK